MFLSTWAVSEQMVPLLLAGITATGADVQARMDADVDAGRPLVAHVHVALADNTHQGIVPTHVPSLGDGQNPKTNLYWGALYGVRSYFPKKAGWRRVAKLSGPEGVLERLVLRTRMRRSGKRVTVYLVADAWDGRRIKETTERFLAAAAGRAREQIEVDGITLEAGGAAHVVAYVGHNGFLGDFTLPETSRSTPSKPRSGVVLACASKHEFKKRFDRVGAHALLLTTNLMAPEAYTLDAALRAWFSGEDSREVHAGAARAYTKYQKAPLRVGQRLFWSAP